MKLSLRQKQFGVAVLLLLLVAAISFGTAWYGNETASSIRAREKAAIQATKDAILPPSPGEILRRMTQE